MTEVNDPFCTDLSTQDLLDVDCTCVPGNRTSCKTVRWQSLTSGKGCHTRDAGRTVHMVFLVPRVPGKVSRDSESGTENGRMMGRGIRTTPPPEELMEILAGMLLGTKWASSGRHHRHTN